jgi:hypothetical protein
MTLEEHIAKCRKAISSSFGVRNVAVECNTTDDFEQVMCDRRANIRNLIHMLRMALDPMTSGHVAKCVVWKLNLSD